jgi:hypothetical protein
VPNGVRYRALTEVLRTVPVANATSRRSCRRVVCDLSASLGATMGTQEGGRGSAASGEEIILMGKQPTRGNDDPVESSREVVDRELEKDNRRKKAETGSRGDPRGLEKKEEGGGPA